MRSDIVNKLIWKLADSDFDDEVTKVVVYPTPKFIYRMQIVEEQKDYLRCRIIKQDKKTGKWEAEFIKIGKGLLEGRKND